MTTTIFAILLVTAYFIWGFYEFRKDIKTINNYEEKVKIEKAENIPDVRLITDRACPCLYLDEPCNPSCSCKNKFSSYGCDNCCTYGSLEQRKEMAKFLNKLRLRNNKEFLSNRIILNKLPD